MEKLETVPLSQRPPGDRTLAERFVHPFGRVTIQRPLHHFDKALKLSPGVPDEPSLEVLVRLLTGHRSHNAILRQHLDDPLYRSFENLVRGRNKPTGDTLDALAKRLKLTPEDVSGMAHGQKQGPLLPQYLQALQMAEGFFSWVYDIYTAGSIPCPCCGNDMLDDTDAFWRRQTSICLNPPEYLFVERCLATLIGWRLLRGLFGPPGRFSLLNPDPIDHHHYPVDNWLKAVREAHGCSDNLQLEKRLASLPSSKGPSSVVIRERLNKWACGEDLIPLDVGKSMVQSLHNADVLRHGLFEARGIVFLQEFVGAAAQGPSSPPPRDVRLVVHQRAMQLADNVRLNVQRPRTSR